VPIPPQPAWFDPRKIVSFDPWGHLVPEVFKREIEQLGLDVRPSIAITKAHIKLSEIDETVRRGEITVDERIVLRTKPLKNPDGTESDADPGVEITTSKAAVEPVWYLPGVAERFGMYVITYMYDMSTFSYCDVAPRISSVVLFLKILEGCSRSSLLDLISRSSFPLSGA